LKLHPNTKDKRAIKRFESLESDFNLIHNSFYDYSISIYKNSKTKFEYTCPKHGVQETTADAHLKGKKCKYCVYEKAGSYHQLNEKDFIKRAKNIHGNSYEYSNVQYSNIHTPISIICKTHGSFFQSPNNHLKGHGCADCAGVSLKTTEQFVTASKIIYGDTYNYENSKYTGNKNKVIITCKIHGDFEQYPNNHLKGHGCERCGYGLISLAKRGTKEEFIEKAIMKHGLKYDYSNVEYINAHRHVEIICKEHGVFIQTADSHLRSGCPCCADSGFNSDLPAILYYLKIVDENKFYFKIGITNNNVHSRFRRVDLDKVHDYVELVYKKGLYAFRIEQLILKKYKNFINTEQSILTSGNTEIFHEDVLDFELLKKQGKELLKNYLQQSI
jgi:hypothetical protein